MKFGKLLAAGKSWVGYPETGRYQMRGGLHLPKFISPKNPFKQEAVAAPVAPPIVAAAPAMTNGEDVAAMVAGASEPAVMTPVGTPVVAVVAPELGTAKVSWPALAVGALQRVGEGLKRSALFCLDHNPFSAIGKPKLAGIPRFGRAAVQGELSLDRVKVVRNDLSHADLEVIGPK